MYVYEISYLLSLKSREIFIVHYELWPRLEKIRL